MDLAVIGIGCHYPGSSNPKQFWENVLSKRQQFRRMLDQRLPLAEYYDPDKSVPDKLYARRAAYIDGFDFDWSGRRIPKKTVQGTDIVQWLALQTAEQAILHAGYDRESIKTERTGVILGNTLTGEQTRSNNLRLRWPYVKKTMMHAAESVGLDNAELTEYVAACESIFKSVFPEVDEDTLQGGLSNTIAGRVANYFDLHGGGYVVDGACASSLLAVCTAASQLASGDLDIALAGGVDVSLDTFELIGFAKTGALTIDDMRVYDRRANGFIPGEGAGFVVMKRLEDALADNNQVYAVVKGWGVSSDGKGGITAPSDTGQARALIRAYERANYTPEKLDFIEGHGTGTPRGDVTELRGIANAFKHFSINSERSCGVTSLKSILGHTKAAAGIGAFIKTAIAVNQRVIPPTAGCSIPNDIFSAEASMLYPSVRGSVGSGNVVTAGVSAMGFGGINTHVTLQSHADTGPAESLQAELSSVSMMASAQDAEVLLFSAETKELLLDELASATYEVEHMALAELADYSNYLCERISVKDHPFRAAVIAVHPEQTSEKIGLLCEQISATELREKAVWISPNRDVMWSYKFTGHPLSFALPGQGSQQIGGVSKLIKRHDWAKDLLDKADEISLEVLGETISSRLLPTLDHHISGDELKIAQAKLMETQFAQPAICLCSILVGRYLSSLGVKPSHVFGHSLGELTALTFAGVIDEETLLRLACLRGQAMSNADAGGAMASISASEADVTKLFEGIDGYVTIANLNAPDQTIISGEVEAVESVVEMAKNAGLLARPLPVSGAFHSDFVAEPASVYQANIKELVSDKTKVTGAEFYSSVTGKQVTDFGDLGDYLAKQITSKVDFITLLESLGEITDSIIEVGTGSVLSGLMAQIKDRAQFVGSTAAKENSEIDQLQTVAYCFVTGNISKPSNINAERFLRPYTPFSEKLFIENPCERTPEIPESNHTSVSLSANTGSAEFSVPGALKMFDSSTLNRYFDERGQFISQVISADLLSNPIKGGVNQSVVAKQTKMNQAVESYSNETIANNDKDVGLDSSESGSSSNSDIPKVVISAIAEITGFSESDLHIENRLLDDLNLDSIKAGQLLNSLKNELAPQSDIDPANYANASAGELISLFVELTPVANSSSEPEVNGQASTDQVSNYLVREVSQVTGFPEETIIPELRLLDDLNLDSIKSAQIINAAMAEFGVSGDFDAATAANDSISELVEKIMTALSELAGAGSIDSKSPVVNQQNWVNAYKIQYVSQASTVGAAEVKVGSQFDRVILFGADGVSPAIEGLTTQLTALGLQVVKAEDYQQDSATDASLFLLINPIDEVSLQHACERLTHSLQMFHRSNAKVFINIDFGVNQNLHSSHSYQAIGGLLRSCSIEHPELAYRMIAANGNEGRFSLDQLLSELDKSSGYTEAVFDSQGTRHVPTIRPHLLARQLVDPSPKAVLEPQDVVLITGGGKGITAQCAIALSEHIDSKFLLMGRTPLSDDDSSKEVISTLEAIQANGNEVEYASCDLTDLNHLSETLENSQSRLGPISAFVHGAGLNSAKPFDAVSSQQAFDEIATKVEGFNSVIDLIGGESLKLIVSLTSIIGVAGMPGNAWYAYSNGALNYQTQCYQQRFPKTKTISLAYSVWGEVGMGHRMGVVDSLSSSGIGSVPTQAGIDFFLAAVRDAGEHQQWVIAGPMSGLKTWQDLMLNKIFKSRYRFLDSIESYESGDHCSTSLTLNVKDDLYLLDHDFRGSLLFPTVMALEAMAQVGQCVMGATQTPRAIQEIMLTHPIVATKERGEQIRIDAQVTQATSAETILNVGIYCASSGFDKAHFSANLIYASPSARIKADEVELDIASKLAIDPKSDLYGPHLFQGPLFQRLKSVYAYSPDEIVFSVNTQVGLEKGENGFKRGNSFAFLLGDPFYRDTLLQVAQLPASPKVVLPLEIGSMEFFVGAKQKHYYGKARRTQNIERDSLWDIEVYDEQGNQVEELKDYRVRTVNGPDEGKESVVDLINKSEQAAQSAASVARKLETSVSELRSDVPKLLLSPIPALGEESPDVRLNIERDSVANILALTSKADCTIRKSEDGEPVLITDDGGSVPLSMAHSAEYLFCAMDASGENIAQGCDVETINPRPVSEWQSLLGARCEAVFRDLIISKSVDHDCVGTMLWTVAESVFKYSQSWDFVVDEIEMHEGVYHSKVLLKGEQISVYSVICDHTAAHFVLSFAMPEASTEKHSIQHNSDIASSGRAK